ncbi:MAG: hypothetical protein RL653_1565 [Pseudomonadota bacterium]|jgi:hypothetical protein
MHIDITWKGKASRLEWTGERVTLGGELTDTRRLEGAPAAVVEVTRSGPHLLLRTAEPHSLDSLLFPAHVWRLWAPGEQVSIGEHLRLTLVTVPGDGRESLGESTGTSALARHLLGDESEGLSPESASLVVLSGRDVGRRLILGRTGPLVLGRGRGAALALMDETISRAHLGFQLREGSWWVEDLGGPNGLFVDGRRWKTCALKRGAVLELGRVWLRFVEPVRDEPARDVPLPVPEPAEAAKGSGLQEAETPATTEPSPPAPSAAGWLRALIGLGGAAALIGAAWL